MERTRYSRQILIKPEFSRKILEKYTNIKFHENLYSGSLIWSKTYIGTDGKYPLFLSDFN